MRTRALATSQLRMPAQWSFPLFLSYDTFSFALALGQSFWTSLGDSSFPNKAFSSYLLFLVALVAPTGALSALAAALVDVDVALRLSTVGSCSADLNAAESNPQLRGRHL